MRWTHGVRSLHRGPAKPSDLVVLAAKALRVVDGIAHGDSGKAGVTAAPAAPTAAARIGPVEWR